MPTVGNIIWDSRINNKKLKKDEKETKGILGGLKNSITKGDIFAGIGLSALAAFKHVVDVNKKFEKSLSSLQSILGFTKEEMGFFKDASIEMGASSTKTSLQVVEAFKLIGSQKPELLANRDALKEVTEQAIILSEAAEIDVPIAAKALTGALNQMGEAGDQASRYINVLAAGSKAGAADIPFLNAAIEKSGAVARDANLSFEELVAGIETIAPSISEPTTAGLQFRDVLLRLQTTGRGMESGAFNLKDALAEVNEELNGISDPTEKAAKETEIFGKVSLVAGKALLNNTKAFDEYTDAVTDTNTALEQQATNTDNLDGDIARFNSAVEALVLSFNGSGGLNNAIRDVVQFGTILIEKIGAIGEHFNNTEGDASGLARILTAVWEALKSSVNFSVALIDKFAELSGGTGVVGDVFSGFATIIEGVFGVFQDMSLLVADFLDLDLGGDNVNKVEKLGAAFGGLGLDMSETDKIASDLQKQLLKLEQTKKKQKDTKTKTEIESTETEKKEFDFSISDVTDSELESEAEKDEALFSASLQRKSNFRDSEFAAQQQFDLNMFLLGEEDAEKVAEFEEQQEIQRLERKLLLETELTQIQKDAIQSRILLLEKEEAETSKFQSVAVNAAESFASAISNIQTDSNKTAAENAEERRKVLLNGIRDTAQFALNEILIMLFADAVKKAGVFGLVGVPLILGGAKALFNTLIPKFAAGGVVGAGSTSGDKILARLNTNEVVSNGQQQANLLHNFSKTRISGGDNKKLTALLDSTNETNELLKTQKGSVVHGDKLLITNRFGIPTDTVVSLS